ncbi:MAG: Hsp70 family protein [Thermoguttaceae bacterium]
MIRSSPAAVGIDLGTTFSVLARIDERGRPTTVVNAEGDLLTPSDVLFDGDEIVVGKEALKAMASEADRVAECSKRDVGHPVYHKRLEGKQYAPQVIEAMILNKLRVDASRQLGPVSKAVVTVPAYFDEVRRKATQDAGYMAGLEVLDILNEPTAAALAFGFRQGYLDPQGSSDSPRHILVYDLGGGTFDVTVMQIRGTEFNALATDGDVRLGGYDWDMRLMDIVADEFVGQRGGDPREDPVSAGKLWRECEDAKRTLSARQKAAVACDCHGVSARIEVAREQFEEVTQDLLDRTRFTTVQTLRAAGLDWSDLDRVLLVGGSSRMPMVRRMLRELSGQDPDDSVAADEAVAHGAALHASLVLARHDGRPPMFTIHNVNSHSLGVVGRDPVTHQFRNGIVIPRNTRLPVASKRIFRTHKAGQRSIGVSIVEGESSVAAECTPIGRCSVRDLQPQLPARTPVEVVFRYAQNGRLAVEVAVPGTDHKVVTEVERENGMSKERIDVWRRAISGLPPGDYS